MNKLTFLLILLLFCMKSYSQNSEFTFYSNGLIYNEQTMAKLNLVVDSLNLKFKNCNLNTDFYSKYQTLGYIVTLKEGNIKAARADLKKQISLDDFLEKYPKAVVEKDVLITKNKDKDYFNKDKVEFRQFDL